MRRNSSARGSGRETPADHSKLSRPINPCHALVLSASRHSGDHIRHPSKRKDSSRGYSRRDGIIPLSQNVVLVVVRLRAGYKHWLDFFLCRLCLPLGGLCHGVGYGKANSQTNNCVWGCCRHVCSCVCFVLLQPDDNRHLSAMSVPCRDRLPLSGLWVAPGTALFTARPHSCGHVSESPHGHMSSNSWVHVHTSQVDI